jgi:glycosyltransferase involved in cell wall biosynthesis
LTLRTLRELGEYDVIHPMVFPTPATDALVTLAKLRRQLVVLTDVGGGLPSASTYLQRIDSRLAIGRLADGLALLSSHSAGQFGAWPQPQVILFGGARVIHPDTREEASDVPYALFVGRLLPHKGVLELIESIGPDIPLHVVGRAYDSEYLTKLQAAAVGKRVCFLTDADDSELARQYLGARLVLQPSIPVREGSNDTSELLGLVALEGMAYGKPVIVTRAGSLPELVRDGETGFVVPPRDREALADRIGRLMLDARLAQHMGAAARSRVSELFTWESVARRGLDFYLSLMAAR